MHSKSEAHLKCVVIASYFRLYIAISRVPALENSIARAIVIIAESAALGRCGCRRARGRQDQWGRHARSLPGCCYLG